MLDLYRLDSRYQYQDIRSYAGSLTETTWTCLYVYGVCLGYFLCAS